jgi:formate hydrogenlyase subunit 6/NADH:ubiquinone oxidoreductase subunit I
MTPDLLDRFLRPLRRGPLTRPYPATPVPLPPTVRGLPELDPSRCDASGACVTACPTRAITLDAGSWTLDVGRCIFCGDCARACPRDAIRLGDRVELAAREREALIVVVPLERGR